MALDYDLLKYAGIETQKPSSFMKSLRYRATAYGLMGVMMAGSFAWGKPDAEKPNTSTKPSDSVVDYQKTPPRMPNISMELVKPSSPKKEEKTRSQTGSLIDILAEKGIQFPGYRSSQYNNFLKNVASAYFALTGENSYSRSACENSILAGKIKDMSSERFLEVVKSYLQDNNIVIKRKADGDRGITGVYSTSQEARSEGRREAVEARERVARTRRQQAREQVREQAREQAREQKQETQTKPQTQKRKERYGERKLRELEAAERAEKAKEAERAEKAKATEKKKQEFKAKEEADAQNPEYAALMDSAQKRHKSGYERLKNGEPLMIHKDAEDPLSEIGKTAWNSTLGRRGSYAVNSARLAFSPKDYRDVVNALPELLIGYDSLATATLESHLAKKDIANSTEYLAFLKAQNETGIFTLYELPLDGKKTEKGDIFWCVARDVPGVEVRPFQAERGVFVKFKGDKPRRQPEQKEQKKWRRGAPWETKHPSRHGGRMSQTERARQDPFTTQHNFDLTRLPEMHVDEIVSVNPGVISSSGNSPHAYAEGGRFVLAYGIREADKKQRNRTLIHKNTRGKTNIFYGDLDRKTANRGLMTMWSVAELAALGIAITEDGFLVTDKGGRGGRDIVDVVRSPSNTQ